MHYIPYPCAYMEAGKASILTSSEPAAAMLFGAVLYAETPGITFHIVDFVLQLLL